MPDAPVKIAPPVPGPDMARELITGSPLECAPKHMSDDYYPAWLAPGLLHDDFPWDMGVHTTLPAFLSEYTLHDSNWIGFAADPTYVGGGTAVIRFDAFWTDGRVPHPGSVVAEWPILLVQFARLDALAFEGLGDTIGGISRTISSAESAALPDRAVHRTVIEDIFGGVVRIDHAPEVTILCLDRERCAFPLPLAGDG